MIWNVLLKALFIFVLRVIGISVSTVATILTVQGRRRPAILAGSLSSFVYIVAIGRVVTDLENGWNIAAYVLGYGVGTWLGMLLERRMALGFCEVHIISTDSGDTIAAALREAGFGATQLHGRGRDSDVGVVQAFMPRRSVPQVVRLAEGIDNRSTVTVTEVKSIERGYWRSCDRRQRR